MKILLPLIVVTNLIVSCTEVKRDRAPEQIKSQLLRHISALYQRDANVQETILADDFNFSVGTTDFIDKAEFISDIHSGILKIESAVFDRFFINNRKDNQVAVTYNLSLKATWKGKDYSGNYAAASIWINQNEKWELRSEHLHKID